MPANGLYVQAVCDSLQWWLMLSLAEVAGNCMEVWKRMLPDVTPTRQGYAFGRADSTAFPVCLRTSIEPSGIISTHTSEPADIKSVDSTRTILTETVQALGSETGETSDHLAWRSRYQQQPINTTLVSIRTPQSQAKHCHGLHGVKAGPPLGRKLPRISAGPSLARDRPYHDISTHQRLEIH